MSPGAAHAGVGLGSARSDGFLLLGAAWGLQTVQSIGRRRVSCPAGLALGGHGGGVEQCYSCVAVGVQLTMLQQTSNPARSVGDGKKTYDYWEWLG